MNVRDILMNIEVPIIFIEVDAQIKIFNIVSV